MTREARERTVREHMDVENKLDFDAALATFERPRYELIGTDTVHDGPEEVMKYYLQMREAFPDQRNEIISLRHADDAVIAEFWLLGTHKGRLGRLEPTGRTFKVRMMAFSSSKAPASSANASTSTQAPSSGRFRAEVPRPVSLLKFGLK